MKVLYYILLGLIPLFCTSCWTVLKPGTVEGPIVNDSPQSENKIMSGKMAVNYVTTSLVMKCLPHLDSGKERPKIINEFVISSRKVNHLQMQVWRRLISMNMIIPIEGENGKPAYKLSGEITRLPERVNDKFKYYWTLSMTNLVDEKEVWREEIEFGE